MINSPRQAKTKRQTRANGNGAGKPAALATSPVNGAVPTAEAQTLYLIGRPTLNQYLRFVRREAINPPDDGTLLEEWQAARDHIRELEKTEAGAANRPVITPIDTEGKYRPLLLEFLEDPLIKHGFNTVPTEVAFVELDTMVVYQHHIDLTHVAQLKHQLGPAPSDEDIFRTCLPYGHLQPPARWSRMSDDTFVFLSPSNDLRFLGHMRLTADNLADYPPPGAVVGIVGLPVGFGSNFLNAFYADNRLILNNGSHRAYALRELGVTHVPCIVQHVANRDALDVVACSAVRKNPDHFLKGTRPPMLKDYFNPKLRKVMPVHRLLKQVTVKYEVKERYVPAF